MKVFKLLSFGLLFYFLIPYVLFFRFFNLDLNLDYKELFWAFKNSFLQSFLSALLVTVLGIPLSLGLFKLQGKIYSSVLTILLIPQILPTLFSILIAFSIWKPFPLGSVGISFIFMLIYLGFATTLIHHSICGKMGSYAVVSEVFGLSRLQFFKKIFFPLMRTDLLVCFLLIFIFCFSSFSIPLVAGGGRDTNIELLIFEKIFIGQKWSAAWTLSVIQNLFLLGLSLFLIRRKSTVRLELSVCSYLTSSIGFVLLFIYLIIYLAGYVLGLVQSLPAISQLDLFYNEILAATFTSLKLLFLYLLISFSLLYLWLHDFVVNHRLNFASHLLSVSTVLVGFVFYLFFPQSQDADFIKIPIALSILYFPVLFKSFLEKTVLQLKEQVIVAQVYSISTRLIVWEVIIRRLKTPLMVWFSFLTIWFLSDFATLSALGTQSPTLGLMAGGFISGYRLSLAYLMSLYILIIWLVILALVFFLTGVWRVPHQKFKI